MIGDGGGPAIEGRARSGGGATESLPNKTRPLGRELDLENSTCQRTLCADGTVSESIVLVAGNQGRELSDNDLEEWVAGFPIEVDDDRICPRRLQPP